MALTKTGIQVTPQAGGAVLMLEGTSVSPNKEAQISAANCTAFVRILAKAGEVYKAQIWTARHCLPDFSSKITKSELRIFDGRSGYAKVNLQLALAKAREGFFNLVQAKIPEFTDAEKKQKNPARIALDYTFLEEEGKKNYGADCKQSATEKVSPTRLCSALQDFRILDAELSAQNNAGLGILNSLLSTEEDSQRKSSDNVLSARWSSAVRKQMELESDISRGRFVDTLLQCGDKSPSAVCTYKETLIELARKWRAPSRDLVAEAERDGFSEYGESYADFRRSLAADHYSKTLAPLFKEIETAIAGKKIKLGFAGHFSDAAGRYLNFSAAPLEVFYSNQTTPLNFVFFTRESGRDALMYFESPAQKELVLNKGDSGSLLMLDERTPFMVMSAKGENSISGGASILALPEATGETAGPMNSANSSPKNPTTCKK
ncbi:MAG: hypothetical protein EBR09_09530 [Proteobacteria bacterium]|nr:hypothetical protein [Pseudomonadota bacterium]